MKEGQLEVKGLLYYRFAVKVKLPYSTDTCAYVPIDVVREA